MKVRQPAYFKDFRCTASACSDNCCIGWEIDIDRETNERYRMTEGTFGKRLKNSISKDKEPHFLLIDERCPFLNRENLCDIILTMGNDCICEICREHPRFYEWFGYFKEAGLGLCCEEAARLLLYDSDPLVFEETEDDEDSEEEMLDDPDLLEALLEAREAIFEILQDRSRNLRERFGAVMLFAEELQELLDEGCEEGKTSEKIKEISSAFRNSERQKGIFEKIGQVSRKGEMECEEQSEAGLRKILELFEGMEAIDEKWPEKLKELRDKLPFILDQGGRFKEYYNKYLYEYEHIAVYFIYRYFLKAYYDRDVISKAGTAAVSCLIIWIMGIYSWMKTGTFCLEDQIQLVKAYSKEMEYSIENLERLQDAFWTDEPNEIKKLCCLR